MLDLKDPRNDGLVNGALIAMGALGIFDNIVIHWIFELHRAIPGPHAFTAEVILIIISAILLAIGLRRELRARRRAGARRATG